MSEVAWSWIGGRKFVLTLVVVALAFGSLWAGQMSDSITAQLVGAALAFYGAANVAQKRFAENGGNGGEK